MYVRKQLQRDLSLNINILYIFKMFYFLCMFKIYAMFKIWHDVLTINQIELMKNSILYLFLFFLTAACSSPDTSWPEAKPESRPGTRWWWLGNAVDSAGLTANMEDLHHAGFGTLEITPIYGIDGAEHRHIDYLSPRWMNMYKHVVAEGYRLGIQIDMTNGTGWPFGGSTIDVEYAATRVIFQQYPLKGGEQFRRKIIPNDRRQMEVATVALVMAYGNGQKIDLTNKITADRMIDWTAPTGDWTVWVVFNGKTLQRVKRAAPGGEGLVMNHYSRTVLDYYLKGFDMAFNSSNARWPRCFFNDSYEVYGADWSENLFAEFEKRRGYRLQDFIPELNREGDPDICARVVTDYRLTLGELLLDEFTVPWTKWANRRGVITRNQAHGSPGNLIDFYAAVDIPECESFGRTLFDIPGLRVDSGMRQSDAHPSMLKFSSSAAHITGKTFVSSETFTWLTEHFRTSLSQMKPELDQMFASGVNHMFYHGSTYSPRDVPWPGWLFYASVNMNTNNTIFRDVRGLNDYIARTQSFLQYGQPDNDFLVYLPIWDVWQQQDDLYLMFDIHKIQTLMPSFFDMVVDIQKLGFDTDYISDKYLEQTSVKKGKIKTSGASYKAIIVPNVRYIPVESFAKLLQLAKDGATVIFADRLPDDVPGLHELEIRRAKLNEILATMPATQPFSAFDKKPFGKGQIFSGTDYGQLLQATTARAEELPVKFGVNILRRQHSGGHHYFIAMLQNKTLDGWVKLAVEAKSAMIFDPLTGESGKANIRKNDGQTEIYLQLAPGQSIIVKTFASKDINIPAFDFYKKGIPQEINGDWTFRFTDEQPAIEGDFTMLGAPVSWTELENDSAKVYAGTGRYTINFELNDEADEWLLDLGKLRESARVRVNGYDACIVWALPFTVKIGKYLKTGTNTLEVDVTNLPANRIRDFDKRGVNWRIFKDINIVSVFYRDIRFDSWAVSPSGLTGAVTITPLTKL